MLDINALFPQIAELKQKTAKATASSADSVSFDDILKSSVAQTQAAESDSLTMEDLIEMVTVPEDLKAAVTDLSEDSPKTDQELKAVSKKIHVFSLGLVDVINNSVNANEVAQAEMDLQFLMIGTFQLTKSYGYASAADDLLGYWKKLDIRSQSFSALIKSIRRQ
ncbi:hypothetical protein EBR96_00240 [bacterium]|nr:hypothetical protein [bacterium]